MTYKTSQHGAVTVISVEGNLMGGPDATTLHSKLHELVDKGRTSVVIDLKGVTFINSSGLGMLIGGASTVKNAGGTLKLANASEKILTLIKITKLSSVFEHFDSVKGALESFKK